MINSLHSPTKFNYEKLPNKQQFHKLKHTHRHRRPNLSAGYHEIALTHDPNLWCAPDYIQIRLRCFAASSTSTPLARSFVSDTVDNTKIGITRR